MWSRAAAKVNKPRLAVRLLQARRRCFSRPTRHPYLWTELSTSIASPSQFLFNSDYTSPFPPSTSLLIYVRNGSLSRAQIEHPRYHNRVTAITVHNHHQPGPDRSSPKCLITLRSPRCTQDHSSEQDLPRPQSKLRQPHLHVHRRYYQVKYFSLQAAMERFASGHQDDKLTRCLEKNFNKIRR